jgi:MoaE-MoaD fusion protein
MSYKIQLFAGAAEALQTRELVIALAEPATLLEIRNMICDQFPHAASLLNQCFFAVNEEYKNVDTYVHYQDRLALIPPVSGGQELANCMLTTDEIQVQDLIRQVSNRYAGAILTFVGIVREFTKGRQTICLEYEAYADMAIKTMQQICDEIRKRWPETKVAMVHRLGQLNPEDISIAIAVATPHRPQAFEAGRYAIERFKQIVPIWKKEKWSDGSEWIGEQTGTPWNPLR